MPTGTAMSSSPRRRRLPAARRRGRAPGPPPAWGKVALLRELLESHELVLWIDADAVVVDGRDDIADELEPDRFIALVRHRPGEEFPPNPGGMLARPPARALLERIWNSTEYLD